MAPQCVQHHSELKTQAPPPDTKKMPKAERKSKGDEEEDVPIHGVTNEKDAKKYSSDLDTITVQMGAEVNGDVIDAMKNAIVRFKDRMVDMFPNMETADPNSVWKAVKDKVGLSIMPKAGEVENALEYLVPDEDIPREKDVLEKTGEVSPAERELIKELFDSLEVVHSHLAMACSTLSRLSGTLRPSQLMTILDASIRPLVQIRSTDTFKLRSTEEKAPSLPEDPEDRVEMLMVPDPKANTLKMKR